MAINQRIVAAKRLIKLIRCKQQFNCQVKYCKYRIKELYNPSDWILMCGELTIQGQLHQRCMLRKNCGNIRSCNVSIIGGRK